METVGELSGAPLPRGRHCGFFIPENICCNSILFGTLPSCEIKLSAKQPWLGKEFEIVCNRGNCYAWYVAPWAGVGYFNLK